MKQEAEAADQQFFEKRSNRLQADAGPPVASGVNDQAGALGTSLGIGEGKVRTLGMVSCFR